MSWLDRLLRRSDNPTVEQRSAGRLALLTDQWGAPSFANVTMPQTAETAMRLAAVWSCVNLIADAISSFPINCFRGEQEIPLPAWLQEPASGTTLNEWVRQILWALLMGGNAFGLITSRSGAGMRPSQVELLDPAQVSVAITRTGTIEYQHASQRLDTGDVWHVRGYPVAGSALGLSPLAAASWSVGLGLSALRYSAAFFEGSSRPDGVLQMDGTLSREGIDRLKASWEAAHRGKRTVAVLESGLKWQTVGATNEQSQLVELAGWSVSEVCRIYNVPSEMLSHPSGNSLTYSSSEARAAAFVRHTLGPWMVKLENAISRLLPRGQRVRFNPDALLRGTTLERYQAHEIALRSGFLTVDEVRALEDLEPLGEPNVG